MNILDLVAVETTILSSLGDAKKMLQQNGIAINMEKFSDLNGTINADFLVNQKFIIIKKGKKEFSLIVVD